MSLDTQKHHYTEPRKRLVQYGRRKTYTTYIWQSFVLLTTLILIVLFSSSYLCSAISSVHSGFPRGGAPSARCANVFRWLQHMGCSGWATPQWASPPIDVHGVTDTPETNALEQLHYALQTMQTKYFELWLGTWPESIDWTAAVLATYISASLSSLSRSLSYVLPPTQDQSHPAYAEGIRIENEINKYFSQSISYYFGENALDIRYEAYDDMLWVVLGWLETIQFIELHSSVHYSDPSTLRGTWYGKQFAPGFAHRARIFFDLAKAGWNTRLCGGGMIWNPRLLPYKNAITNQLFISASVEMYLHFPGDSNRSPFLSTSNMHSPYERVDRMDGGGDTQWNWNPARPHDPAHLRYAIDAYSWLSNSNMTNDHGLYVDGFHIRNYGVNGTVGTGKCDVRNEMVYTYNQGVILSGLRGLWESTGKRTYLEDGHSLIRNVLASTGWDLASSKPNASIGWAGLGRNGILEELCDSSARCSQDGQTFKGIYFHHLTLFCQPLPIRPRYPGVSHAADKTTAALHSQSCREYATWVAHNAVAAMDTRDKGGKFGMWWGAGQTSADQVPLPDDATDYRNWDEHTSETPHDDASPNDGTKYAARLYTKVPWRDPEAVQRTERTSLGDWDLNDRGRGRTVETQGGGVAVVRAMWEFVQLFEER